MRHLIYEVLLVLDIFLYGIKNGYTQNSYRLCICFNENLKHIDISFSEDSVLVAFNIVREGFETEEKRKKAKEKWFSDKFSPFEPPISFYYRFISNTEPEELNSISKIGDCEAWVKLEEFRQKDFKYPEGIGGSKVYFIQMLSSDDYLKWSAILMASE